MVCSGQLEIDLSTPHIDPLSPGQKSAFPTEWYRKILHVHHYFCLSPTVPHIMWIGENRLNLGLSFRKVPRIFTTIVTVTCPGQSVISSMLDGVRYFTILISGIMNSISWIFLFTS